MSTDARESTTSLVGESALSPRERERLAAERLVEAIGEFVDARRARARNDDEYVNQDTSGLGRKRHCRLARDGVLNARKVGRKWLVTRADLEAYLEAHGRPSPNRESAAAIAERFFGRGAA